MPDTRLIIYQVFPRLLTNLNDTCIPGGTLQQNGSGKFNDYTYELLSDIKSLGVNAIWYTGYWKWPPRPISALTALKRIIHMW